MLLNDPVISCSIEYLLKVHFSPSLIILFTLGTFIMKNICGEMSKNLTVPTESYISFVCMAVRMGGEGTTKKTNRD